jgi:hypothetical protein
LCELRENRNATDPHSTAAARSQLIKSKRIKNKFGRNASRSQRLFRAIYCARASKRLLKAPYSGGSVFNGYSIFMEANMSESFQIAYFKVWPNNPVGSRPRRTQISCTYFGLIESHFASTFHTSCNLFCSQLWMLENRLWNSTLPHT